MAQQRGLRKSARLDVGSVAMSLYVVVEEEELVEHRSFMCGGYTVTWSQA
jgi:hypothetical protein